MKFNLNLREDHTYFQIRRTATADKAIFLPKKKMEVKLDFNTP